MTSASFRKPPRLLALASCALLSLLSFGEDAQARPPRAAKARSRASAAPSPAPAPAPAEAAPAQPSTAPEPDQPPAEPSDDADEASADAAQTPPAQAPAQQEHPAQPSAAAVDAAGDDQQLAALRQRVGALMDDLVQARSRAALLGKTLFKTRVRVRVMNLAAPDPVLAKLVLSLDGAPIFRGQASDVSSDDARMVFEGFIAPGAHVLSVELEQQSRDDAAYGYTQNSSYRFRALPHKRSELTLVLDDDSDLASDFPDDQQGEYDVRARLKVEAKELNEE